MTRADGRAGVLLRAAGIVTVGLCVGAAANVFSDPTLPFATPERAAVKDLIEWQLEVEGKQASLEDVYGAF